jgi:hypothetical protein
MGEQIYICVTSALVAGECFASCPTAFPQGKSPGCQFERTLREPQPGLETRPLDRLACGLSRFRHITCREMCHGTEDVRLLRLLKPRYSTAAPYEATEAFRSGRESLLLVGPLLGADDLGDDIGLCPDTRHALATGQVPHGYPQSVRTCAQSALPLAGRTLTSNLLSTVLTTISSGWYWLTSNRSFRSLLSPSSWMSGELNPSSQVLASPFCVSLEAAVAVDEVL